MYKHAVTQANINKLVSLGNHLIAPNEGELASGLCGAGRMEEPETIVKILSDFFAQGKRFQKKKVLITAGPTYEAIDPVRFVGNRSSGKMGYAIANVFAQQGAEVTLISGPVSIATYASNIQRTAIQTAEEMHTQCIKYAQKSDIIVMAAAIADYTPEAISTKKIKKNSDEFVLKLKKTKDVLKELGRIKKPEQILVGFALETDNEKANALKKVQDKNLDFIVLNSMKDKGAGFGFDTNKISVIYSDSKTKMFSLKSKDEVALDIVNEIFNITKSKKIDTPKLILKKKK
jgi:phosphopantothenoylcysteine decarboxylase/phosphopantothenate--cysteine ligase